MASKPSTLQKEYNKQLRLLKQRLKRLLEKGKPYNPEQIEAITKKKSHPTKRDIERLKSYRKEKLQRTITRKPKLTPKPPEEPTTLHTPSTATPYIPKAPTMIDTISEALEVLDEWTQSQRPDMSGYSSTLLSLWNATLTHMGYPDMNPALWTYENYLEEHEAEIMEKLEIIRFASGDEQVRSTYANLFQILKRGTLTAEELSALSEISDSING